MKWERNCRIYRNNKQQTQLAIDRTIQQEVDQGSEVNYNPTTRFNNGRGRGFQSVNTGPQCYRCRQFGHFQWQCNVRLDHSKHLNCRPPCTRGGY